MLIGCRWKCFGSLRCRRSKRSLGAPLCSGLARRPLKAVARVRIPSGLQGETPCQRQLWQGVSGSPKTCRTLFDTDWTHQLCPICVQPAHPVRRDLRVTRHFSRPAGPTLLTWRGGSSALGSRGLRRDRRRASGVGRIALGAGRDRSGHSRCVVGESRCPVGFTIVTGVVAVRGAEQLGPWRSSRTGRSPLGQGTPW